MKINGYSFEKNGIIECDVDENARKIKAERFYMGLNPAPIIKVKNFIGDQYKEAARKAAKRIMRLKDSAKFKRDHVDSIQVHKLRMKAHCGHYYGTNKEDKSLKPCKLTWTHIFNKSDMKLMVEAAIINCYNVLKQCGCNDDVEWLLGEVGVSPMVLMVGFYKGGGIIGHIDEEFVGPVIVIILWNKVRETGAPGIKCISFGMQGGRSINPDAEIHNEMFSCYIFWSWLVDFGVHGVPTQGGCDSVVLIIRKGRRLQ